MGGSLSVKSRIFSSFCLFIHPTHIHSLCLLSPPTVLLALSTFGKKQLPPYRYKKQLEKQLELETSRQ